MDNTQKAEIPTLAALPALLPTTTTECIFQHLEQLSAIPNDLIWLHTAPVGFYDAVSRVNSFLEFRTLSTFRNGLPYHSGAQGTKQACSPHGRRLG